MATATREETKFIQKMIIFWIIPLMLAIFVMFKMSARNDQLEEKIVEKETQIKRFIAKKKTLPTLKTLNQIKEQIKEMRTVYEDLKSFASLPPIDAPEKVVEKAVYFKERLYMVEKAIKQQAAENEVTIPDSLGFGEGLPVEKDVPLLLRKLETLDKTMQVLIKNRVSTVTVIKVLENQRFTDANGVEMPFTEISVRFDINCGARSLLQILYDLGTMKPYIVVKSIGIKHIKEGILETSLVCSRLVTD